MFMRVCRCSAEQINTKSILAGFLFVCWSQLVTQRHIKSGRGTTVVKSILLVTQFIYDAEIFNTKVMFIGTHNTLVIRYASVSA